MGRRETFNAAMRPADIRRAVSEWVAQGFAVTLDPDGTIRVLPPTTPTPSDDFDQVDLRR